MTASPGEHAERPLHPAGAPEEINQLASAVAVRGDIAYQPAPVGIKEQRQFTAFFHMEKKIAHFSALSSVFGDLSHLFIVLYQIPRL